MEDLGTVPGMLFSWVFYMMSSCELWGEAYFPNSQRSRKEEVWPWLKEGGSKKEAGRRCGGHLQRLRQSKQYLHLSQVPTE